MKKFGFELLRQQVIDHVDGETEWMVEEKTVGDSEIEKLFFLAILFRIRFGSTEYSDILVPADPDMEKRLLADTVEAGTTLFIRPQAHVGDYRVDFLITAMNLHASVASQRVWRRLVVECDGHQFHERTKEQAAKDRSRDRWLTSKDFDVYRFTGSELWRDPWACAEQVLDWALKGWFV
jgi:very-short-patch-repair endonuclease